MKQYKIWIEGILGHEEQLRSYPTLEESRQWTKEKNNE